MKFFLKTFFIILSAFFVLISPAKALSNDINLPSATGVVEEISSQSTDANLEIINQYVLIKILNGQFKGEKRIVENVVGGNPYYDINLKAGDKVIMHFEPKSEFVTNVDDVDFFISDLKRDNGMFILGGIFALFLVAIGGYKGFRSLISIVCTVLLIFGLMMPMILNGFSPIFSTVVTGIIATSVTVYTVSGLNKKSTSAIIGTVASLIIAGFLAIFTIKISHLTGYTGESNLFLHTARPDLNMQGILASAIILSALGALMDVGVSIASTVNEIYLTDKTLSWQKLFTSGMNVGKDIIGTMSNTLILVYLGASLPLVLLSKGIDLQKFFNLNQVVTEISSALIGSIAILSCVPLTALISSLLVQDKQIVTKLNEW